MKRLFHSLTVSPMSQGSFSLMTHLHWNCWSFKFPSRRQITLLTPPTSNKILQAFLLKKRRFFLNLFLAAWVFGVQYFKELVAQRTDSMWVSTFHHHQLHHLSSLSSLSWYDHLCTMWVLIDLYLSPPSFHGSAYKHCSKPMLRFKILYIFLVGWWIWQTGWFRQTISFSWVH